MNKLLKILLIVGVVAMAGLSYFYFRFEARTRVPAQLDDPIVYIPTGSSFEEVLERLRDQEIVRDEFFFRRLSEYMNYDRDTVPSGRYRIQPGWSMIQLVRHLRGNFQDPVDVVLTNERLLEDVAAKVALFVEADSADFMTLFTDPAFLNEIGYTEETLISVFIPNTYEVYWDISPRRFMERMLREHERFWDREDRRTKAEALGLTPEEVYTLASIVEKETLRAEEKERMAGVYLNRLQSGMLLQADPTSVFARRDFDTPRVTDYHTKFDSPYNTYMYPGLPPGPITMSSISSIDGVLNAEEHDYLYFCAVGDGSGRHAFAKTLAGHNENARRYRENLVRRGLR